MSIISNRPIRTTGAAAALPEGQETPNPVTAPGPTITHYQQLADDFSKALDAIVQNIPSLAIAHPTTAKFVRGHLNVPNEFLATAIQAVEQTARLQSASNLDTASGRDTLQFLEAFRPILDRLDALRDNLKYTLDSRKASLAADSLQVYYLAKGMARDPGEAAVIAHVRNLKRDLGRRGPVKASVAPVKQPAPPFAPVRRKEEEPQAA